MLTPDLLLRFPGDTVPTQPDLLEAMAKRLQAAGAVDERFLPALLEREANYPTGLPTEGIGFAIPHADAGLALRSAMCVALLSEPVAFHRMDCPEEQVSVQVVVMLALANPDQQAQVLGSITRSFEDARFWRSLVESPLSHEDLVSRIKGRLMPEEA
jgi:PTS system galactitol-specific IIA component